MYRGHRAIVEMPPPLIPPQGGKVPTNHFILGVVESNFEKQERKSSPLVPLQRGKAPTNQFILGLVASIFEKREITFI